MGGGNPSCDDTQEVFLVFFESGICILRVILVVFRVWPFCHRQAGSSTHLNMIDSATMFSDPYLLTRADD